MSTPAGQKIVVSSPLYPKPLFFPFPPLSVSVAGLPRGARWIERKWCWSGSETECVFMCKCVSIQFQRLQYRVQRFFCSMHLEINPGQSLWCFFHRCSSSDQTSFWVDASKPRPDIFHATGLQIKPQYITLVCVSLGEYMSGNMKKRFNYMDHWAPLDLVLLPERWIKVVKWHLRSN